MATALRGHASQEQSSTHAHAEPRRAVGMPPMAPQRRSFSNKSLKFRSRTALARAQGIC